ncbi:hypothetical protein SAMN05445504_2155 [Burkholderia sp. CF099]|nr:hypothetical protein SAMN05445504_2155 [Burkholderia sp. CF099]
MYQHDLRYFFRFYSVTFAELCELTPHFTSLGSPLLYFFLLQFQLMPSACRSASEFQSCELCRVNFCMIYFLFFWHCEIIR